jgi:hypothetical protein
VDTPGACLPAEPRSESTNNSLPHPSSLTTEPYFPNTQPHLLETTPQQQLLTEDRERQVRKVTTCNQQLTMTSKRARARKLRKARRAGTNAVVAIKSEPLDSDQDAPRKFVYGGSTGSSSYSHSRSPPRQQWAAPRADSIINLISLCTYPGQTIHPDSVNRLFILQRDIDAVMYDQGPPVRILRRLPRDITLTIERKEAIWLAQGKINRVVDERQRWHRRFKLDRYVPADRWVTIDRYVPGMPYNPNPYTMPVMRLFSRSYW